MECVGVFGMSVPQCGLGWRSWGKTGVETDKDMKGLNIDICIIGQP